MKITIYADAQMKNPRHDQKGKRILYHDDIVKLTISKMDKLGYCVYSQVRTEIYTTMLFKEKKNEVLEEFKNVSIQRDEYRLALEYVRAMLAEYESPKEIIQEIDKILSSP
jgi:hypothetical protein